MKSIATLITIIAGAVAGAIVALVVASGSTTDHTRTVTTVVRSAGSTLPTSLSKSQMQGKTINQIYRQDEPGVVDIDVTALSSGSGGFGFFGGGGQQEQEDEGAGVVYNSSGYIVTDEHVIAHAMKVRVNFWNGKSYPARVIGSDASTDVGVIKVDAPASELHPLSWANSNSAQVGDPVVAIGSPFGLAETVTSGIVSQTGRSIQAPNGYTILGSIQTDAPINPGNSGGPLLDAAGQVLGLNDQIETSGSSDQSAGVGFATPGNTDRQVADTLIAGRKVQHAYVGVCLDATVSGGAQIATSGQASAGGGCSGAPVVPGSPAAKAGLRPGDVITAVNGHPVASTNDFIEKVDSFRPGQTVTFTVKHDGSTKQVKVTLGTRPANAPTG
jgi:putative serine protease PepD